MKTRRISLHEFSLEFTHLYINFTKLNWKILVIYVFILEMIVITWWEYFNLRYDGKILMRCGWRITQFISCQYILRNDWVFCWYSFCNNIDQRNLLVFLFPCYFSCTSFESDTKLFAVEKLFVDKNIEKYYCSHYENCFKLNVRCVHFHALPIRNVKS